MQPPRAASRSLGLLSPSPFWIFFSYFSFDQTGRDARCGTGDAAEWRSHVHLLWEIKLPGLNSSGAAGGAAQTPPQHQQSPPDVGQVLGGPHPCGVCTQEAGGCCCSAVTGEHHGGGAQEQPPGSIKKNTSAFSRAFSWASPAAQPRRQPQRGTGAGSSHGTAQAQGGDTHEPLAREVEGEGGALGPTGARPHVPALTVHLGKERSENIFLWGCWSQILPALLPLYPFNPLSRSLKCEGKNGNALRRT